MTSKLVMLGTITPCRINTMSINQDSQFLRVLNLYRALPRAPEAEQSINHIQQLCAYDSSQRKTLQRDLELLEQCLSAGIIEKTPSAGNTPAQYRLSMDATIEQFAPELSLVLVMANSYLQQHLPSDTYSKTEGFFMSAEQQLEKHTRLKNWSNRVRFIYEGYCQIPHDLPPSNDINNLYQAILDDDIWLKISYMREYDNAVNKYTIKPHGIINRGRKQFIIASKITDDSSEIRTFCLHRMLRIKPVTARVTIELDMLDIDFALEQKEHEYARYGRDHIELKLRCDDQLLQYLQDAPFCTGQRLEETKHGYFYLYARTMIIQTVFDWLVEKASLVRVIEPVELSNEIKSQVRLAAYNYDFEFYNDDTNSDNDDDPFDFSELDGDNPDDNSTLSNTTDK